ncbi:DNA-binding MarR family transcriptional regulator [Actinoplanes tereljensis]|uniref:MarR family transcriptional regulator n=1 Tax=Paractinoplanes tereljensis TaxID=571912 RepID=A0A919NLV3_9ACTN|nr:MarR family transcriptional regulator [Actinoplanes tereljensis]GIF20207.1 MarR family transcriptional regulator [Actinoplanes tereljensis]
MQPSSDHEPAVLALMRASRALVGLTVRALADVEADVTIPQFRALVVLATRGSMRGADIAEELNVNPSTGTRMTDRLVGKGLVRRVRSTDDRRVVQLRLSAAGRDIVEKVMARRRTELERIVAETAPVWQPAVTDALTAFAVAAGEMPEQEWWMGWTRQAAELQD